MINLLLGFVVMLASLMLQAVLFVVVMRFYTRSQHRIHYFSFISSFAVISSVLLLLVIGTLMQIAIWALLFLMLGEFSHFNEAFYHSAVNFSTLGYGDLVMSEEHRLLGPLQAVNGVIMIGLATSSLTVAFQDIFKKAIKARLKESEQ